VVAKIPHDFFSVTSAAGRKYGNVGFQGVRKFMAKLVKKREEARRKREEIFLEFKE
jgi:hypothetical protein